jgi:uncharacterized protein (TIGR02646 family)
MQNLFHPINLPRALERRYKKPVGNATKAWENFKNREKGSGGIYRSLIPAQKKLCPYCETVLSREALSIGYHIEHIELKSIDPSVTFKFENLLVSCFNTGFEINPSNFDSNPISCGHAERKKVEFDLNLFIKPTLPDCERYFFYELDGRITPHPGLTITEAEKAKYTIDILNLDCKRLTRLREEMIVEGYKIIDELLNDKDALKNFIELELAVINSKHFSFITARRQFFEPLL